MHDLHQLIKLCIKHDTKAEYALYKECYAMLMPLCYRYVKQDDDAADLMNRGFLKILNNLHLYDESKPFDKWIKTILINTIIDEFRKAKRKQDRMVTTDMNEMGQIHHPVDWNTAENKLNSDDYLKVIRKLPEMSRNVFNMYVFEEMDHKEIAQALQIPEGTSRWHLSTARGLLRKSISKLMSTFKTMLL
jgi:RNA polymerase sigma factor (sigma-70 family)